MTRPFPRPNIYLPSFILVYPRARPTAQYPYLGPSSLQLSLEILLFLSSGKSGISILGSRTSYNYVISSSVGVFSPAKEHALDTSAFRMPQHLLRITPCPPRSMMWWRSYSGDFFCGESSGNFPVYFSHPYISCSKNPNVPLFESSTLKNQSEVPFHIFVSYL